MIEPTQEQMYMTDLVAKGKLRLPTEGETMEQYEAFVIVQLRGAFSVSGIKRFALRQYMMWSVDNAKTKEDLRSVLKTLVELLIR